MLDESTEFDQLASARRNAAGFAVTLVTGIVLILIFGGG